MDRHALAQIIDHTLLTPTATVAEVSALCSEAIELGLGAICISPSRLPLPVGALPPGIGVVTVVGFPSGAHRSATKATEAMQAVGDGATEVDMVIDLGTAHDGDWAAVESDIAAVREAAPAPILLKVIIESATFAGESAIADACLAAEAAGADFVKTSTGFHPAGGATVEAVRVMATTVGGKLGIKASGGIRTAAQALAMIDAGATRLGCSASRAVLAGVAEESEAG
ncbi:MAG: deoxyribose-phosphate aldolase [Acidimicrobiales bacterium]|nr:deoxyribose-phosphate aldolase [Acidimicrobiales bacterium]